ncbi:MAG: acyl carrier protein [Gemmatimonadales bacterium]
MAVTASNAGTGTSSEAESRRGTELRVHRIFVDHLALEVDVETDVIDSGMLDSVAFVQLLVGLEQEFGVTVDVAALQLDDFRSISRIARFVSARPSGSV